MYVFDIHNTASPEIPRIYNVQSNSWSGFTHLRLANSANADMSTVKDPNTGVIYLAGEEVTLVRIMDVVNPIKQTLRTVYLPDPEEFFPYRSFYGSVWSKHRNSILFWRGTNKHPPIPEHCMAASMFIKMPRSSL